MGSMGGMDMGMGGGEGNACKISVSSEADLRLLSHELIANIP